MENPSTHANSLVPIPSINITQNAFLYAGAVMDTVKVYHPRAPLIKGIVKDHKTSGLSVHDLLGELRVPKGYHKQIFNIVMGGVLGVHKERVAYEKIKGNWSENEIFPTIPYIERQLSSKFYLHDTLVDVKENINTLTRFGIPVFGENDCAIYENTKISGISKPYYLIGEEGTVFGGHREDEQLASVLYLVSGLKKWYIITTPFHHRLLEFTKEFNSSSQVHSYTYNCNDGLSHKNLFVNPQRFKDFGIKVEEFTQSGGEMFFISSGIFHYGYNVEPCIAVSKNCCDSDWLKFPKLTETCTVRLHGNGPKFKSTTLTEIVKKQEVKSDLLVEISNLHSQLMNTTIKTHLPSNNQTGDVQANYAYRIKGRFAKNEEEESTVMLAGIRNELEGFTSSDQRKHFIDEAVWKTTPWTRISQRTGKKFFLKTCNLDFANQLLRIIQDSDDAGVLVPHFLEEYRERHKQCKHAGFTSPL